MSWLTGNPVIDAMAVAGFVFYGAIFLGFPLWMLRDRLRGSHGEHWRPISEAAPAASEPVAVVPRSPFRHKREVSK
jgi:hypothetical protein